MVQDQWSIEALSLVWICKRKTKFVRLHCLSIWLYLVSDCILHSSYLTLSLIECVLSQPLLQMM